MKIRIACACALVVLGGCVSTQFAAVVPGEVAVENLTVTASDGAWNKAPDTMTGSLVDGSEMWTRDGLLLDRLILIPGVANGGTLFESASEALVYPEYKSGMLPNEIVELTQSSLAKLTGNEAVVETSGLRPHRLGEQRAIMFDMTVTTSEGPRLQGRALAFINNDELYLITYIATAIFYFDKHWDEALAIMESANVSAVAES